MATGIFAAFWLTRLYEAAGYSRMTSRRYLETGQPVPGQGMSYTLYEVEGEDAIVRMLTYVPETGRVSCYPKPPVKKLFAPERCTPTTEERFLELWRLGGGP